MGAAQTCCYPGGTRESVYGVKRGETFVLGPEVVVSYDNTLESLNVDCFVCGSVLYINVFVTNVWNKIIRILSAISDIQLKL